MGVFMLTVYTPELLDLLQLPSMPPIRCYLFTKYAWFWNGWSRAMVARSPSFIPASLLAALAR